MTEYVNLELETMDITKAVDFAFGAASTCWDGEGVFDTRKALLIADQLKARIEYEIVTRCNEIAVPIDTVASEPKEWIERQNEERKAWAIGQAVEMGATDVVAKAKELVNFVRGKDEDLHDQEALDNVYLAAEEMGFEAAETEDLQNRVTTLGVRFRQIHPTPEVPA